jgi:serine/threonine-protein kinase
VRLSLGRYVLFDVIASGGMASVHFGRMVGPAGFTRTVAIKRLHPHLSRDAEFATMFLDEARLAARIQHPNVVPTLDVVSLDGELLLVMDYVRGETLSRLIAAARERKKGIPTRILSAICVGTLYGLDAAHEAKSERGEPLAIVHRDVSPQNVLVGADGVVRVVDFGVAKAASRAHSTRDGKVKGKLSYMAPEQLKRQEVDRRADVYAVGVMLWEALAGRKLFVADDAMAVMDAVVNEPVPAIATLAPGVSEELASIVHRALDRDPARRFPTAMAMAEALEVAAPPAQQRELAAWVKETAGSSLEAREAKLAEIESSTPSHTTALPFDASVIALSEQPTAVAPAAEGSLVTGISVVSDNAARRRSRWPVAVLGLVATAGVAGLIVWRPWRVTTAAAPSSIASSPVSAIVAVSSGAPSTEPPPPPVASVAPTPTPPTTTSARPTRNVRVAPAASAKVNCNPPVFVDSAGIEHIKPECL